jgi:hypothetical protein
MTLHAVQSRNAKCMLDLWLDTREPAFAIGYKTQDIEQCHKLWQGYTGYCGICHVSTSVNCRAPAHLPTVCGAVGGVARQIVTAVQFTGHQYMTNEMHGKLARPQLATAACDFKRAEITEPIKAKEGQVKHDAPHSWLHSSHTGLKYRTEHCSHQT